MVPKSPTLQAAGLVTVSGWPTVLLSPAHAHADVTEPWTIDRFEQQLPQQPQPQPQFSDRTMLDFPVKSFELTEELERVAVHPCTYYTRMHVRFKGSSVHIHVQIQACTPGV